MRFAATLGLLLFASCVGYLRFQEDEPIAAAALQGLRPGVSELGDCLCVLGAPNQVFEHGRDGMALLWNWRDVDDWSVDLSIPLQKNVSAKFEWDSADEDRQGCVLWFDENLRLERWRFGAMGELLPERARASLVE